MAQELRHACRADGQGTFRKQVARCSSPPPMPVPGHGPRHQSARTHARTLHATRAQGLAFVSRPYLSPAPLLLLLSTNSVKAVKGQCLPPRILQGSCRGVVGSWVQHIRVPAHRLCAAVVQGAGPCGGTGRMHLQVPGDKHCRDISYGAPKPAPLLLPPGTHTHGHLRTESARTHPVAKATPPRTPVDEPQY